MQLVSTVYCWTRKTGELATRTPTTAASLWSLAEHPHNGVIAVCGASAAVDVFIDPAIRSFAHTFTTLAATPSNNKAHDDDDAMQV
jgi:hypothetical protein